jgi:catechol 2,3-dioxygenase-like lactoylglutathione lyase family enzyme
MRLHHVSIPAHPDNMDAGRDFYGALLGLVEIPAPESLGADRVVWFRAGECELHLFKEEQSDRSPTGRHFCFAVDDLQEVRTRLETAGIAIEETTPVHNRPRFFCQDPFGNRLELTQILGPYQ